MRLIKWLDEHFEETLMIILLIIIACVTMIQVIVRKVPWLTSLTWAEEFCRFMWIWSVFISLPYTIRMENMLRVGVLVNLLLYCLVDFLNLLFITPNRDGILVYILDTAGRNISSSRYLPVCE